jgi:hypothetical protein
MDKIYRSKNGSSRTKEEKTNMHSFLGYGGTRLRVVASRSYTIADAI